MMSLGTKKSNFKQAETKPKPGPSRPQAIGLGLQILNRYILQALDNSVLTDQSVKDAKRLIQQFFTRLMNR